MNSTRTPIWKFPHKHKYGVGDKGRRTCDGFLFDSIQEHNYYQFLKIWKRPEYKDGGKRPLHVDVHPRVTLGPGDRVEVDFIVWFDDGTIEFQDVKSSIPHRLAEFRRLQRRWNHPAGPLVGITWKHSRWQRLDLEINPGEEK